MFEKIIEKINKAERIGIFGHVNPDGDSLGSTHSLKIVLEEMGKTADVFLSGNIEPCVMELICGAEEARLCPKECDLLVALDCADADRLGEWKDEFVSHPNTAAIDHHITHKSFADETVVRDISSACEVVYGMYREMGIKLSMDAATNLYIGLSTDTGNFKYSCTSGETHRIAAELIEMGVDFCGIAKKIFDTYTKEYLALQDRAINRLKFYCGGRVSVLTLLEQDFKECGIDEASASSIVVLPAKIAGVEVGVYIRNRASDEYKVSLRSVSYVDVAEIAAHFGGGGHIRAAGYSVSPEKLDENIRLLTEEIEKQL